MKRFPATAVTLLLLLIGFAVELKTDALGDDARLIALGALPAAEPLHGEYWRLLTYALLHAGWGHLALNAGLLYWLGRIVERRTGARGMAVTFLLGVLGGGLVIAARSLLFPQPGSSVGASAGVYGLLACALVLLHRSDARCFEAPALVRRVLWLVLALGIATSFLPGVSLAGHVGGLSVGLVAGLLLPLATAEVLTA